MDKVITICLPQFLLGRKNSFVKKAELMIAANLCVYTVHHCIKPESPSDGRRFVILTSK